MSNKTVRIAELQEEDPTINPYTPDDPYAPRPDASKRVAAKHRAVQPGRPMHDTEPITPLARPARQYLPFGIGAIALIAVMIGAASYQLGRLPSTQPLAITPSAQAFEKQPQEGPSAPISATIAPTPVARLVSAYAAPDGLLLGQIEEDRMMVPVAHYGSSWVQADVEGSGLVWLRAQDVPDLALTGPDLAPVAVQPVPEPRVNVWTPPEATPVPDKGTKAAPDRAARYATAVARDHEAHGTK
jgi:hypothetical protein